MAHNWGRGLAGRQPNYWMNSVSVVQEGATLKGGPEPEPEPGLGPVLGREAVPDLERVPTPVPVPVPE